MANSIALITKYSTEYFDKVYKQESVTSLLDTNSKMVRFEGARTVKIAKFTAGGLLDYDRTVSAYPDNVSAGGLGYAPSSVGLKWEEFTMSMDRAAKFTIEYFDDEETGGQLVGLATTEISRTIMVPEVDAYALSKIAANAGASATYDSSKGALAQLNTGLRILEENEVTAENKLIFMSPKYRELLRNSNEIVKYVTQGDFAKDVKFSIESYEGSPIVVVTPRRLHAGFMKVPTGGYAFAQGSKAIDFIICDKASIIHVVKYEKVKVLSGDLNLAASNQDGYTIFARIYHDVFIPDNKKEGIYVQYEANTTEGFTLNLTQDATGKLTAWNIAGMAERDLTGVTLYAGGTATGNVHTGGTAVTVGGTAIASAATVYAVVTKDGTRTIIATATASTHS